MQRYTTISSTGIGRLTRHGHVNAPLDQIHQSVDMDLSHVTSHVTDRCDVQLRSLALPGALLIVPKFDKLMRPQAMVSAARAHQAVAGGGEQPVDRLCCQRSAVRPGEHEGVRGCQLGTPAAQPRLQLQTS